MSQQGDIERISSKYQEDLRALQSQHSKALSQARTPGERRAASADFRARKAELDDALRTDLAALQDPQ